MASLASCGGDSLKIWNITTAKESGNPTYEQIFNPHPVVNCLAWAGSNQVIATGGRDGKIAFSQIGGGITSLTVPDAQSDYEVLSLSFNSNSRFICCGGNDFFIHIWDLKKRYIVRSIQGHSGAVTSVKFNDSDTLVASGSSNGEVFLHSTTTNLLQPLAKSIDNQYQGIRELKYSPLKKNTLATCSDDGSIIVYDTTSRNIYSSFAKQHHAPASGISFSTVNHLLLCSVGLDKRIFFYDIVDKRVVKTLVTDSPLTSVSFMEDGVTIAVGSSNGKVMIYDLRSSATNQATNTSSPIFSFNAHSPNSINALQFQNSEKLKSKVSPKDENVTAITPAPSSTPVTTAVSATTNAVSSSASSSSISSNISSSVGTRRPSVDSKPPILSTEGGDPLSPIKSGSSASSSSSSDLKSTRSIKTKDIYNLYSSSTSSSNATPPASSSGTVTSSSLAPEFIGKSISQVNSETSSPVIPTKNAIPPVSTVSSNSASTSITPNSFNTSTIKTKVINSELTSSGKTETQAPDSVEISSTIKKLEDWKTDLTNSIDSKLDTFQKEIKSYHSELQEIQISNHQDIQNLHLEVLRQSQLIQNMLEAILKKQQYLVNENDTLKQENQKLRNELQKHL